MKKIYLLLMLLLVAASTTLKAQELPCKVKYINERCKERYREDSNGNKHGNYIAYDTDGEVILTGSYIHGKEQGNWRIRINEIDLLYYRTLGYGTSMEHYIWYENGEAIARDSAPITSLSKAQAIAKVKNDEWKKLLAKAKAESEAEKKAWEAGRAERERMEQEVAKKAAVEAEIQSRHREKLNNVEEVTLSDFIAAGKEGATKINWQQIENFMNFLNSENGLESYTLYLGDYRNEDYTSFKAAALKYVDEKANINLSQIGIDVNYQSITLKRTKGKIRNVELGESIFGLKYKDGISVFRKAEGYKNYSYYVASGSNLTKVSLYSENFSALSEEEKVFNLIATAGLFEWRNECFDGSKLNFFLARVGRLQPQNQKETAKFLIDIFQVNGARIVCENGATEDKGVLSLTYSAYLLWFMQEREASERFFYAARDKGKAINRRNKYSEWVSGSYSDYINEYFHDVFIRNSSMDSNLRTLSLAKDKDLKKFLKTL